MVVRAGATLLLGLSWGGRWSVLNHPDTQERQDVTAKVGLHFLLGYLSGSLPVSSAPTQAHEVEWSHLLVAGHTCAVTGLINLLSPGEDTGPQPWGAALPCVPRGQEHL